ncbi:MAG: EpsI family protein [Sphingopyxis sp.]|nr:EpsI family protein [Sphingopyxis sp.]
MNRREVIFAAGCAVAAGGALWLRPDNYVRLMPNKKLVDAIPERFGAWDIDRGLGVVMPPSEGTLADRLYDEIMARAYFQPADLEQSPVMCLMTYGARQSDALQLHRPEVCYPAVGFQIIDYRKLMLSIGNGAVLPAVEISTQFAERREDVLYWTRVGEDLPQNSADQRRMRLRASLSGDIGDGVLVRMSALRADPRQSQHPQLRRFAAELLAALDPAILRGLVGTRLASALRG